MEALLLLKTDASRAVTVIGDSVISESHCHYIIYCYFMDLIYVTWSVTHKLLYRCPGLSESSTIFTTLPWISVVGKGRGLIYTRLVKVLPSRVFSRPAVQELRTILGHLGSHCVMLKDREVT